MNVAKDSNNEIVWVEDATKGNKYFCPEPMTAMIDAPNLDMPNGVTGYTEVKPQQSYEVYQRFFTVK